jgi:hypothetical protein
MAATLLMDANLPQRYWGYAILQSAYLKNRLPMRILNYKSPFELTFGTKPDLQYVRRFGCRCFVHIPRELQSKIGHRSQEGIYLGNTHNGYTVELLANGKIIESRDVIFDELTVSNALPYESFYDDDGPVDSDYSPSDSDAEPSPADPPAPLPTASRPPRRAKTTGEHKRRSLALSLNTLPVKPPSLWTVPPSIASALNQQEWVDSLVDEFTSLRDHECYDFVYALPPGRKALGAKVVFSLKTDALGNTCRAKSRFVAQGFRQVHGVDYIDTYSPVAGSNTLRLLLSIAASLGAITRHFDVKTAFLNGVMDTELFVRLPPQLIELVGGIDDRLDKNSIADNKVYLSLKKGLYGTKQASRIWNQRLTKELLDSGLSQSGYDPCLFYRHKNGTYIYILVYVDDLLTVTNDHQQVEEVINRLRNSKITINDLGEPSKLIGLQVSRPSPHTVLISQESYAKSKIEEFHLDTAKDRSSPAIGPLQTTEPCGTNTPFRQLIGSLQYLASGTRPDIAYSVSSLSRFNNNPGQEHWTAAKNVLRYVKGTQGYGISYCGKPGITCNIDIECFVDSDFATSSDAKSISGYVIKIAGGPIIWSSRKQSMVTLSSTESELVALTSASRELAWLINVLQEIKLTPTLPVPIFEDNQACISNVYGEGVSNRTKHINIRHFYVQQQVKSGLQQVTYVKTTDNIADILTKIPHRDQFVYLRDSMGIKSISHFITSGSVTNDSVKDSNPETSESNTSNKNGVRKHECFKMSAINS